MREIYKHMNGTDQWNYEMEIFPQIVRYHRIYELIGNDLIIYLDYWIGISAIRYTFNILKLSPNGNQLCFFPLLEVKSYIEITTTTLQTHIL